MALGTLAGAAVGGLASAAGSFGLNTLFGGGSDSGSSGTQNFRPTGINAGGLTSTLSGDNISITPSAERLALLNQIGAGYGAEAGDIATLRARLMGGIGERRAGTLSMVARNAAETAALRDRIAPGISEMRRARLEEIESARQNAVGNLRDNMARRRVLGSSFGQDAIARADSEFAGLRERAAAESTLQEIDATRQLNQEALATEAGLRQQDTGLFLQELEAQNQLLTREFEARRGQFQTALNDLNLQADLAAKLSAGASQQLGANARLESELAAKESAGAGKFFGQLAAPIGNSIGRGVSNFFGGGGFDSSFGGTVGAGYGGGGIGSR